MKCPICPEATLVMSDRQGIEIDYCPQCRGVWLDRGELDKIIDRATAMETPSNAPQVSQQAPQVPAPIAPAPTNLPYGAPQGASQNAPQGGSSMGLPGSISSVLRDVLRGDDRDKYRGDGRYRDDDDDDYRRKKRKKGLLGELFD